MTHLVVIPARWGSTRLPGKPLIELGGHTIIARMIDLARRATRAIEAVDIVVATDDKRIADAASSLNCTAVMTSTAISSGSSRALAVASMREKPPATIVNLQGDAPFLPPEAIAEVIGALDTGAQVATPIVRLDWTALDRWRVQKASAPFSGTSCTIAQDGRALWFSKQILPAIRDEAGQRDTCPLSPVYRHLGLYGYSRPALERFDAAPTSRYEALEGLEQLRFIDLGIPIQTVTVDDPPIGMSGIDTHDDLHLARQLLERCGDPYGQ